jgi:hypothetical protein
MTKTCYSSYLPSGIPPLLRTVSTSCLFAHALNMGYHALTAALGTQHCGGLYHDREHTALASVLRQLSSPAPPCLFQGVTLLSFGGTGEFSVPML